MPRPSLSYEEQALRARQAVASCFVDLVSDLAKIDLCLLPIDIDPELVENSARRVGRENRSNSVATAKLCCFIQSTSGRRATSIGRGERVLNQSIPRKCSKQNSF